MDVVTRAGLRTSGRRHKLTLEFCTAVLGISRFGNGFWASEESLAFAVGVNRPLIVCQCRVTRRAHYCFIVYGNLLAQLPNIQTGWPAAHSLVSCGAVRREHYPGKGRGARFNVAPLRLLSAEGCGA